MVSVEVNRRIVISQLRCMNMDELADTAIRDNYIYLLDNLPAAEIIDALYQAKFFTLEMKEDLELLPTRRSKARKVLSILPYRGSKAFNEFCKALRKLDKGYIVDVLEGKSSIGIQVNTTGETVAQPIKQLFRWKYLAKADFSLSKEAPFWFLNETECILHGSANHPDKNENFMMVVEVAVPSK